MKFFLFFFVFLFSFNVNALTICINNSGDPDSCVDEGTSSGQSVDGVDCYYNKDLGVTQCNTVLGDGSLGGYWDPNTFTCSNFVTPSVGSTGEITCPPSQPVSVKSKTTPNPSKDDKACDPTKPFDPLKPNEGCASEQTAIKTNDLLSEANSKLGSISGSNSANTGLLQNILDTLKGIASQGKDPSGNGSGGVPGNGSGGGSGDGSGGGSGISTDTRNLSSISPTISAFGMCPTPEVFYALGKSYEISYQPLCDLAESMHGIVVAIGALSSVMIVVTAL